MSKNDSYFESLSKRIADFSNERDWEQFHNPKNLSMALSIEAAELMEIFQWLTLWQSKLESLSPAQRQAAQEEIADVMIYAIRLSQMLDFDLLKAIDEKIVINDKKYPVDKIKGKAGLE
ncbi:MAG: nucleotide pyrophosphohydrolase [candidate division Zixibacteria bacterium]|nr:nucleotide pyrophosphohydrolase [candidate division Zixibacteria bacterium]